MEKKSIPNKAEIGIVVAGLCAIVCASVIGYLNGQRHPKIYWFNDRAFGYDPGNKCVATWTWTTNGLFWDRLDVKETPKFIPPPRP